MMIFSPDLGFGDVKLAAIAGAVRRLVRLGRRAARLRSRLGDLRRDRRGAASPREARRKGSLAFGPFMILGAVLGVFWAGALLTW